VRPTLPATNSRYALAKLLLKEADGSTMRAFAPSTIQHIPLWERVLDFIDFQVEKNLELLIALGRIKYQNINDHHI
jgi:hypothetical protein